MLSLCQKEPPPASGWGWSQRAPLARQSGRGFWRQGHFPKPSQPDLPRIPLELKVEVPQGYCPILQVGSQVQPGPVSAR